MPSGKISLLVSRPALLLCAVALATFLTGLGRAAISDSDEAFYAEAAREMVASGDWITPYYNYETRFQKPILYYWFAAAAFAVAGVSESAARLPSALSGVGLVLIAWIVGRRWYSERVGWYAGLVTATNFGYFAIARLALPDLPLAFFIVLTTWAGLEAIDAADRRDDRSVRPWLLGVAGGAALGFLTKGPVGIALPVMVLAPALVLGRRSPRASPIPFRPADLAVAALAFLLLAVPWYAAMVNVHGVAYLHRFFIGENLERFATDRYNEPRSIFFYVPIVLGGLLPWSSFLALWVPNAVRSFRGWSRDSRAWWLCFWSVLPLAFYSISIGKQPRYILPVLPPLAVAIAWTLDARIARRSADAPDRALAWCTTASAILLAAAGALLYRIGGLLEPVASWWSVAGPIAIAAAGLALLAAAWLVAPRRLPAVIAATSAIALLALYFSVYSGPGDEPVQQVARSVVAQRGHIAESATYRVLVRNLVFYAGFQQTNLESPDELVEFLRRPERVLCVLRRDDLDRVRPSLDRAPIVVAEAEYFNAAGLRLGSLLQPDRGRHLDHIVVVLNR